MSYIGQGLPADTFQGFTTDKFTGDGTANKTFTLTKEPFSEDTILVTIDGVVQEPTDDFTVSGTTLTLVGTAANNAEVNVTHMGGPLPIGEANKLDLNGASDQLILDLDGDTTISADTDDQIDIKIGGSDIFQMTASKLDLNGKELVLDADADTSITADTDDQIDFRAGGTDIMSLTATTATFNDGVEITTADNTDTLTLTSTEAGADNAPILKMYRNSSSPADYDYIGLIKYVARNDNNEDFITAQHYAYTQDVSDGTEDGGFAIDVMKAGTVSSIMTATAVETCFNNGSKDIDFRVESDGNANMLLVDAGSNMVTMGKNTDDGTTVGHFFGSVGSVNHVRDDNNVMALVRKSGDGDIISFYKDSTVAGYIGTGNSGDLYIGNDDLGFMFAGGSDMVIPTNKTSLTDATLVLGHPSYRLHLIYASNGTIQTSDRNEKQDEANLTAAETKVAVAAKGLLKKYRWKDAVAKKGDDARIHFGIIAQDLQDAFTAEGLDASKYAMFCSNTWWEKEISVPAKVADKEKGIDAEDAYTYTDHKDEETEGYTKRTRLGVRYDQVLAFIIAGI